MEQEFINEDLKFELLQKQKNDEDIILEDLLMVEDVMEFINDLNKKVDFYKLLKSKRTQPIDLEIEKCEKQIDFFKNVILKSLETNEEKTLNFPGVGRATVKKQKGKWDIIDEEKLKNYLREKKKDDCIQTVEKINKKDLNKLLVNLNNEDIDGAVFIEGKNNITITFTKDDPDYSSRDIPQKMETSTTDDNDIPYFDELN